MQLIDALGLDLRILLAQLVNFAILIFVLWRFAYKPVFNILEERRAKVIKGIADSEAMEVKLKAAEEHKKEIIIESRKEASLIIDEAKKKAEIRYQEIIAKSKDDLSILIAEEKDKIAVEKNNVRHEIKKDVAQMITAALEKILAEKIDAKKDGELIARIVKDLK